MCDRRYGCREVRLRKRTATGSPRQARAPLCVSFFFRWLRRVSPWHRGWMRGWEAEKWLYDMVIS